MLGRAAELREQRLLDIAGAADAIVDEYRESGRRLPGLGHPIHKQSDFRTDVLLELMDKHGCAGRESLSSVRFMRSS
jgi:citrate synthase